jgi:hypothetical protein
VELTADLREQAAVVAVVQMGQIAPRVELWRQQERRYSQLRQYVSSGRKRGSLGVSDGFVQRSGLLDLVLREDLLQLGRLPVICVEQGADIPAHGLREPR